MHLSTTLRFSPIIRGNREAFTHLLRALLRECTYLPDSAARTYLHSYILSRFRKHRSLELYSNDIATLIGRQRKHLRDARKALNTLSRANDGHLGPLEKILALTYGRMGKRKYELMEFLRVPDTPQDHLAVAQLSATSINNIAEGPRLTTRLEALAKAQRRQNALTLGKPAIKQLKPELPKTNAWGRPLPVKRKRNMEKEWYAKTLDRILPPLPEGEWEHLRGLSNGTIKWQGLVRRRGTLRVVHSSSVSCHPHRLTPRYMKRLWAKVFLRCPLMKWDALSSRWIVQWGYVDGSARLNTMDQSVEYDTHLFEGVDHDGRIN
ncbi:hypothetical protein MMC06_003997 [Schaereria dolodes]|nr:hypothetical protein [Schaereria dolodes]